MSTEDVLQTWIVTGSYTAPPLLSLDKTPVTWTDSRIVEARDADAAAYLFTRRCSIHQLRYENTIDVRPVDAPAQRFFAQYEDGDPSKRFVLTADERRVVLHD